MAAPLDCSRPESAAGAQPSGGWRAWLRLSVPDLAWEFLRRNEDYRAEFARAAHEPGAIDERWGLKFGADPAVPAPDAEIFWRADVAPGLVVPFEKDASAPMEKRSWSPTGAARRAREGLDVRLPHGLQLEYRGAARPGGPLLVVLGFDQDLGLRVRAVEHLNRVVRGLSVPPSHLSLAHRERLARSLEALDKSIAGESYRTIAGSIFGEAAVTLDLWRTSSVRAATIRLVKAGRDLMSGGYLKLLRSGF